MLCESCEYSLDEEASMMGFDFDDDALAMVGMEFGADTADHICESTDDPGVKCNCACH